MKKATISTNIPEQISVVVFFGTWGWKKLTPEIIQTIFSLTKHNFCAFASPSEIKALDQKFSRLMFFVTMDVK